MEHDFTPSQKIRVIILGAVGFAIVVALIFGSAIAGA